MKNDDVQLIQRVLAGDDTAFSALVGKYQKQVHALAWRKVGDFHIAEDITQETFLKAYQRLSTLKEPQSFASWLYVITANHCNTWLRKRRLRTQSLETASGAELEKATYSGYVSAENERTTAEAQREVVKKLLGKLKESDRTVITLYYFGGMTYEEISKFLGVSVGAIKNRVYRAQERLKKEEPMIREALEHFQITPNLTENIMREIARMKPMTPSGSKPLVPWAIAASTIAVIFLMLGIGNQHLSRFQKPYSFDATSKMTVNLIEAPIVLNLESEPDVRTQIGNANGSDKGSVSHRQPDNVPALVAEAESDAIDKDYPQWELPKAAKVRLGKGGINTIQFSPDGTQLAVGTNIGVWLYDAETGEEKSLFMGGCRALAFSPDGRFLANGGGYSDVSKVELWEIATGREVLLADAYDTASVLRFSSDGKKVVSVSRWGDSIINLDVESGKAFAKPFKSNLFGAFKGKNEVKIKLTRETDGGAFGAFKGRDETYAITRGKVAIGQVDGKIQLWDTTAHKALSTLRGHMDLPLRLLDEPLPRGSRSKNQVLALAFSPDGTRLASGSKDKTVRLWDTTSENEGMTLQKHTDWTNVLAFSPDGKMLASGSKDKTVQLWDSTTGEPLATFTGHIDGITALAFSPDGTTLVSGSADGMIRFWDTESGDPLADRITGHTPWMRAAAFIKDSSTLASVAFNGVITFWDVKTSQKSTIQATGHRDWFPTLAFSADGTKLVSVGAEGTPASWRPDHLIRLTDVKTGRELATLQYTMGAEKLTFSPDGKTVAFTGLGEIRLWNTETGDEQAIPLADLDFRAGIPDDIPIVSALVFSPDGRWLVSGTEAGKIQMWDVATGGEALAAFPEPTEPENPGGISALVFSPDGTLLAAGVHSQIRLWEVGTGNTLLSVNTEHKRGNMKFQSYPEPLVFSPDGTILANGLAHGAIQLRDVTTGDAIAVLDGHTQKVETLVFSPDGKTLVSTAMDGTSLLWDWNEALTDSSNSK